MKLANMIAAGAALAAGLVGGTATYLVAAQPEPTSEAPATRTAEVGATSPETVVAPRQPIVRLARCKPPAVREGKACVTEVVETVVLPASSSAPAGSPAPSHPQNGDDDDWSGGHEDDSDDGSSVSGGHGDDDQEADSDDHGDDHEDDEDDEHDEDDEDEGDDD